MVFPIKKGRALMSLPYTLSCKGYLATSGLIIHKTLDLLFFNRQPKSGFIDYRSNFHFGIFREVGDY